MTKKAELAATIAVSTQDSGAPGQAPQALLIVMKGNNVGTIFELDPKHSIYVIGREDSCDIQVVDGDVSRRHAAIRWDGAAKQFVITDLQSRNGTFLNNDRLSDVRPLAIGDKVKLGTTTVMRMSLAGEPEAHYAREMFRAALRDGLTGAFNRRYFDERLEAEVAFAKRHHSPLALILVDFDHFKRINDDYGHRAGDFVLQHAVTLLAREVRAEDVVARYGGEEFGVICRDTTAIQAEVLAERLRALVAATPFVHDGQTLPVTVSIGIAEGSSHESAGALVEAADRALYLAKEAGRNCVRVVTP